MTKLLFDYIRGSLGLGVFVTSSTFPWTTFFITCVYIFFRGAPATAGVPELSLSFISNFVMVC